MRQPDPAIFRPPMMQSRGTNTSRPCTGPFWNGMFNGRCRRPRSSPGVSRGISAHVMPISASPPSRLFRVEHAEGKADHGRHRRQRDVALVEVQSQSVISRPCHSPAADDAGVGNERQRPSPHADRSVRSRESPHRAPDGAGSSPSAPRCHSAAAVRLARASWAPPPWKHRSRCGQPASPARRNAQKSRIAGRHSAWG